MATYRFASVPTRGDRISFENGKLHVPAQPIIPFIEGDGTGPDIWRAAVRVLDAAVEKAYGGERRIHWMKVFAGEESFQAHGEWLPDETVEALREFRVSIKGPLTTPVGSGIRSLNVTLRQVLDLYACIRPVRYFEGVGSPMKEPQKLNVVIFRENTEDVYAGIEWKAGSPEATELREHIQSRYGKTIREHSAIGIKPMSEFGSKRLTAMAIRYAMERSLPSVTLVHKGNIMKFTEGAFKDWGYKIATSFFRGQVVTERESWILGNKEKDANLTSEANAKMIDPGYDMMTPDQQKKVVAEVDAALKLWGTHGDGKWKKMLLIKDSIADITLQQVLTRAKDFDVIATLNLNGDYLSDALAAQVGGIGIAPGANINYITGHAIFEATHGTAPKYANLDQVNPGSVILSGEMMLRYMGWTEAADLIIKGMDGAISAKTVTYDFHRMMEGATKLKCSEFGDAVIKHM